MKISRIIATSIVAVIFFLTGCTSSDKKLIKNLEKSLHHITESDDKANLALTNQPLELDLNKRMFNVSESAFEKKSEQLYQFRAKDMDIRTALNLFARSNNLNIIISPDVIEDDVTINFKDLPFDKAMEAILEPYGYYWTQDGSLIKVLKFETKIFTLNYLKLNRSSLGTSRATAATGSGSGGGGGGGGGEGGGGASISSSDNVAFWNDLETQCNELVSEDGKVTINRMAGIINVTDLHENIIQIEDFINSIKENVLRQVELQARILEVSLSDQFSLGLDWNQIIDNLTSDGLNITASSIISAPFGPSNPKPPTIALEYGVLGGDINAVLEAISEQGELKVISNPRVRVMNNQPALIKVGTDRPFFESTKTLGEGTKADTINDTFVVVTEGLVVSITPQISDDGMIMLDIMPIITRLLQTVISPSGSITAPEMEVKQSSTVVRLRDGETITVGGLIQNVETETIRKVPLLGDVPVLGNMFKGRFTANSKTELVIFITPRIVKDS